MYQVVFISDFQKTVNRINGNKKKREEAKRKGEEVVGKRREKG